jgi:hypothetical protein
MEVQNVAVNKEAKKQNNQRADNIRTSVPDIACPLFSFV